MRKPGGRMGMLGRWAMAGLMLLGSQLATADSVEGPPGTPESPADFAQRRPQASAELITWAGAYYAASSQVFRWSREHPDRSRWFLAWMSENPKLTINDFMAIHPDWPVVDVVMKPNIEAMTSFIHSGRRHPGALKEVAARPGELAR